jgi:hypothetical protein
LGQVGWLFCMLSLVCKYFCNIHLHAWQHSITTPLYAKALLFCIISNVLILKIGLNLKISATTVLYYF